MAGKKLSVTKKGKAVFPHLHAPDTKFDKGGSYTIKLEMPLEDGQELVEVIDKAFAAKLEETQAEYASDSKKKGKKVKEADLPYLIDEEAGTVRFSFKMNATGERKDGTKYTQAPALFDSKGQPIPKGTRVGGGSVCRVSYEMNPFHVPALGVGVSLRLKAVQIIELREGGRDASGFGFEAEEEGYSATEAADEAGFGSEGEETPEGETKAAGDF